MKVSELIKELQALNPEYRVVVSGYEYGVDDVIKIKQVYISVNENGNEKDDHPYGGAHEIWPDNKPTEGRFIDTAIKIT